MFNLVDKLRFLYPTYVLAIVSLGYLMAELGHFLIGVTSKATAQDLHYGDISCQLNLSDVLIADLPQVCENATTAEAWVLLTLHTHTSGLQDVSLGISEVVLGLELIAIFLVHFVLKYSGKCIMCCNMQKLNILPTQAVYLCIFMNLTTDGYNSSERDVFISCNAGTGWSVCMQWPGTNWCGR